jgi:MraZ protein
MFFGTHTPRIDEKARLILPAKFRDLLADGLVVTKGQERCLVVWPRAEFDDYVMRLRAAAQTNSNVRKFTRTFFSSVSDEQPDKQGRITLPPALREFAGLDRDCIVIGADTRIEIWDAKTWETYLADSEAGFVDINIDGEAFPNI